MAQDLLSRLVEDYLAAAPELSETDQLLFHRGAAAMIEEMDKVDKAHATSGHSDDYLQGLMVKSAVTGVLRDFAEFCHEWFTIHPPHASGVNEAGMTLVFPDCQLNLVPADFMSTASIDDSVQVTQTPGQPKTNQETVQMPEGPKRFKSLPVSDGSVPIT